jgi:tetratricopeptide (TPR) repeat protein
MKTETKKLLGLAGVLLIFSASAFAGNNEKGIEYYRAELYGAAKTFFLQQTNQTPTEQAENYYYLGQTYYKLEQVDSAKYLYNKAIETDPEYPFGYVGVGSLELKKGNLKQAEDLFKKAAGYAKKDPSVHTTIAEAYVEAEKNELAKEALGKARKINKNYSGIYVTEGDILMKQGKVGDACANYDNAILFNPNDKVAYLKCAQVYKRINPEKALEYLDKLVDIDPNYIPAYAEIGDISREKEEYDKAIAAYEKFISIPDVPQTKHVRYAQLLFYTKQYEKSMEKINSILSIDPENEAMYRFQAYNNYALKNNALALEQLNDFLKKTPEDKQIYLDYKTLGDIYLEQKQFKEAEESYLKALKFDPTKIIDLYAILIKAAEEAKDYLTAIAFYEKYFEANPEYSSMDLFNYGKDGYMIVGTYHDSTLVAAEKGRSEIAAENETAFKAVIKKADWAFSEIIKRRPDNFLGYLWKARLYSNVDAYEQARDKPVTGTAKPYFEEALKSLIENNEGGARNDEIIECYRYFAQSYLAQKDYNSVEEYYKKILEINPNDAQAKHVLNILKDYKQKLAAQKAAAAAEKENK